MAFIVETGSGTANANAYCAVQFVTDYLTDRARESENGWAASALADQQAAIIKATDYVDMRFGGRFGGYKRSTLVGAEAVAELALGGAGSPGETLTLDGITWTLAASLTPANANEILIGADATETAANIVAALTGGATAGTNYSEVTEPLENIEVEVSASDTTVVVFTVAEEGEAGNDTAIASTLAAATLTGFRGGLNKGSQPLEFPREDLYDWAGNAVEGVPRKLRQAVAEYAVRALAAALISDPTAPGDNVAGPLKRERVKAGPVEEEKEYSAMRSPGNAGAGGGVVSDSNLSEYPPADMLLREYLSGGSMFGHLGRA
jgi:hypothetical protein